MKRLLKSKSPTFNKHVQKLTEILFDKRQIDFSKLISLGYEVKCIGKHAKIYFNGELVTTLSKTCSDRNSGNQALRYFRKYWEEKEAK